MVRLNNMKEVRRLQDCAAKRAMVLDAALLSDADEEIACQLEEAFDDCLGGGWHLYEQTDDPHKLCLEEGEAIDLFGNEWKGCDFAGLDNGCYRIFWATNNAGGPLLFVPDEPWVPAPLKERLNDLIFSYESQKERAYGG